MDKLLNLFLLVSDAFERASSRTSPVLLEQRATVRQLVYSFALFGLWFLLCFLADHLLSVFEDVWWLAPAAKSLAPYLGWVLAGSLVVITGVAGHALWRATRSSS